MAVNVDDLLSTAGLLEGMGAWLLVPSPKPTSHDKASMAGWVNLYTTYSVRFAKEALNLLIGDRPGLVVDPFVGAGTTLTAARIRGYDSIGVDLDPFSALVARARVATRPIASEVYNAIRAAGHCGSPPNPDAFAISKDLFSPENRAFAWGLFQVIEQRLGLPIDTAFSAILDSANDALETEVVLLASLMAAANRIAKVARGSNPVWLRRAADDEPSASETLGKACTMAAEHFLQLASANAQGFLGGKVRVCWGDARRLAIEDETADAVLTSPPYLNRLDYVVSHYPAIALAADVMGFDLDKTRRSMIGTTKINAKCPDTTGLGPICLRSLDLVQNHSSFASRRYYYWTYLQYFQGLRTTLSEIRRVLRSDGRGALVIQDSFYKEIRIPAADIIVELARGVGMEAAVVREQTVRQHMGRLSPQQSKHVLNKVLREYVVYLRR